MSANLFDFLNYKSTSSPFKSSLSSRGGYITFSNSGQRGSIKYFTLSLDSFITTIKDILKNHTSFSTHENYIESEWRDLAGEYYTDETANAMATVQTKPLFSTISKLIVWANAPNLDDINSDQNIKLSKEYLEYTIIKLEELAETFKPFVKTDKSEQKQIISYKVLRQIIFESFKYILNKFGEEKVLQSNEIKDAVIEDRAYRGLTINNYFGFETLVGQFDTEQTTDKLKSSGTPRFIDEKINVLGNENSYFTSQWNGNDNGRGLSLGNFNKLLFNVSNGILEIIKSGDIYKLVEKQLNNNASPSKKPENTIFYGSPGTGKSHKINETLKNLDKHFYERITFHPEYDNASFVGGYKPISEKNDDGINEVKYKFVPQVFINIYEKAWKDSENQYYLAIEEINRGNCAEIFGDIFQLLDRNSNYTVTPSNELKQHLETTLGADHEGIANGLKLPSNLTIWATMNTSDQSLFPMDSAFKRRWNWEYIPIRYDEVDENESSKYFVEIEDGVTFNWLKFIKAVNTKIKHNPNLGMDKCIGNYFIKPDDNKIELKEFINKAIFYLWNDVFKDEDERDSIFRNGIFYEDFFPVEEGRKLVLEILGTEDFTGVLIPKTE